MTVQRPITISEVLQPILTQILQILNRLPTWYIPIAGNITRLRQLPERKVLGEFHVLINTYFLHIHYSLLTIHYYLRPPTWPPPERPPPPPPPEARPPPPLKPPPPMLPPLLVVVGV